jgi:hypothetical protein
LAWRVAPVADQYVTLQCACGREHTVDVRPDPGDVRGPLVLLAGGWQGIRGATLARWAREGRLRAHVLERGKLAAWERDVRAAVEAVPYSAPEPSVRLGDELVALADDPGLETAS